MTFQLHHIHHNTFHCFTSVHQSHMGHPAEASASAAAALLQALYCLHHWIFFFCPEIAAAQCDSHGLVLHRASTWMAWHSIRCFFLLLALPPWLLCFMHFHIQQKCLWHFQQKLFPQTCHKAHGCARGIPLAFSLINCKIFTGLVFAVGQPCQGGLLKAFPDHLTFCWVTWRL